MKCLPTFAVAAIALAIGGAASANNLKSDAATAAAKLIAAPASSPSDFSVYVDRETRFAFVKTPIGWKFVRQIEAEKLSLVPHEFFIQVDRRPGTLLALGANQ